jgi:NAD(P)-dependent dehydrogenase (short-subunit alcohol dehydrogenase family)
MQQDAEGAVVVVTGAAKGLGKAIADEIFRRGGRMVLPVRPDAAAAALAADFGDSAVIVLRDVNEPDAANAAMAAAVERWGRIDGLVNNAGVIDPISRLADSDPAAWELSIRTNLVAPYRFARAFLSRRTGSGLRRIVNISSGAAHRPLEGWSAYCAGKAGLAMLTQSLQLEYASVGIRAFGLVPGLVDTDMQGSIRASGVNSVSQLPRSALRPASEPAHAVAYLLSGAGDDLAGGEVEIRDATFRARVGLPPM